MSLLWSDVAWKCCRYIDSCSSAVESLSTRSRTTSHTEVAKDNNVFVDTHKHVSTYRNPVIPNSGIVVRKISLNLIASSLRFILFLHAVKTQCHREDIRFKIVGWCREFWRFIISAIEIRITGVTFGWVWRDWLSDLLLRVLSIPLCALKLDDWTGCGLLDLIGLNTESLYSMVILGSCKDVITLISEISSWLVFFCFYRDADSAS